MAKKADRPSVKIETYESAASILKDYTETRQFLQSIISKYIPNGESLLDYSDLVYLKHCGRTIKGVAERILKDSPLKKKIDSILKINEEAQRELVDERVCIQLDSIKTGNYFVYLVDSYKQAKKSLAA